MSDKVKVAELNITYEDNTLMGALSRCKFIKVKDLDGNVVFFLFDNCYQHNQMYQTRFGGKGIISARFIEYNPDCGEEFPLQADGMSTSIKERPRATKEDTVIVNDFYKKKLSEVGTI